MGGGGNGGKDREGEHKMPRKPGTRRNGAMGERKSKRGTCELVEGIAKCAAVLKFDRNQRVQPLCETRDSETPWGARR